MLPEGGAHQVWPEPSTQQVVLAFCVRTELTIIIVTWGGVEGRGRGGEEWRGGEGGRGGVGEGEGKGRSGGEGEGEGKGGWEEWRGGRG